MERSLRYTPAKGGGKRYVQKSLYTYLFVLKEYISIERGKYVQDASERMYKGLLMAVP